jgi:hypothetical protein
MQTREFVAQQTRAKRKVALVTVRDILYVRHLTYFCTRAAERQYLWRRTCELVHSLVKLNQLRAMNSVRFLDNFSAGTGSFFIPE